MIKWINRGIYGLGILTLAFGIYVASFFAIKSTIISPFESQNYSKEHELRPVYNRVYYPMRWFSANRYSLKPKAGRLHHGILQQPLSIRQNEPWMRNANIRDSSRNSLVMIGFTGKKSLLEEFDEVQFGSNVRMVFGSALARNRDRFINKLVHFEVIELMEDPRIKYIDFTEDQKTEIRIARRLSYSSNEDSCVESFIKDYSDNVLEHCLQAGYANNVGGGCYHVVGRSVHLNVEKHALETCSGKTISELIAVQTNGE